MSHEQPVYASDLTDAQWALIEALIPVYTWGRPRKLSMRSVVNATLYILVTGCQWAMLPKEYKTTAVGGERGFDGGKMVKGRKRHILVDTLGNLLKVLVSVANMSDGKAAIELLKTLPKVLFKRLKRIWADGGYRGEFVEWVAKKFKKIVVDITLRSDDLKGFEVIPWRWVVERSFAWLGAYRRLSKDYEFFTDHSESMIYLASIHRLLKRLAPAQ